ncbi:hypothetical protein OH491_07390 [Termitidicoccus mucosus]|uniref:Glycine zipper 2TM domain-containing protein n=2 Tax=Termitidicoccus mucosus TaxID=1184151 RepID=A0A178IKN3_9BACT|nr:hypothetical protein AW736_26775 [Opitutaceae bacterium TSB47]
MKTTIALLLSAFAALLSGCASLRQPATDIVLTGAGGAIGYHASGKSIKGAAIGAGAGYLVSKIAGNEITAAIADAERHGYDRAMNQAVKQQYWIIQNQQRGEATDTQSEPRYVNVRLPETVTPDGVILKPATITLRTE